MNFNKVINYIGAMLKVEATIMLLPFIVSLIYLEPNGKYFLFEAILLFISGIILQKIFIYDNKFYYAEGFITASIGWIFLSAFGALPFYLSGEIPNYIDAVFETVSGFTTTGATILGDVTKLSHCMNFWRCFTHFVGGMGVLVLMLAIIPTQSENMQILKAESPGPQVGKLVPRVSDTARMLYIIYITLTLFAIVSYVLSGMPLFDSICIGLGTAGTGGFTVTKNGCADYGSLSQLLIAIFMMLFGVNFNIYYLIILKKIKVALKSEELKTYFFIIFISIILIIINTANFYNSINETIHNAIFHVSSIITTTGFAIDDYTLWPQFSKAILLTLMIIGGSAGSTAGGLKVSRIIILAKHAINELYLQIHPRSVKLVKFEDKVVPHEIVRTIYSYTIIYILFILVGFLLVSLDNLDFETTFSSVIETFNNIGLGLCKIGPKGNFSIFSYRSKIIFILLMLTGRLEIFPIIVLFSRKTWRRES